MGETSSKKGDRSILPTNFIDRMVVDDTVITLCLVGGREVKITNLRKVIQDAKGDIWIEAYDLGRSRFLSIRADQIQFAWDSTL